MSVLNASQRAVIAVDTGIDSFIIDRVCDAYDSLLRGDVEAYKRYMATAIVQMGFERPVRAQDRPTAVDKIKTIIIRALSDEWHCSFKAAAARLARALEG